MRIDKIIFVLVLAVFVVGCSSERIITDRHHPSIEVKEDGGVTWRGEYVEITDIPGLLEDAGFTSLDTINIRIPENLVDYRVAYALMKHLRMRGYTRPILVTDRIAISQVTGDRRSPKRETNEVQPDRPIKKRIRYK